MMVTQFQITLTESLHKRAEKLAKLSGRTIEEMLPVMLMLSAPIFTHPLDLDRLVSDLPDEDVLAIANLQMLPDIDSRHSDLLQALGEDKLPNEARNELNILQRVYEVGIIYQSFALKEAVLRGLREPLEP
jgi:hypothetical protein